MSRYIDADALKKDYGMGYECDKCPQNTWLCQHSFAYTKMDICGWIDDAPTIDAVERKRGEWVDNGFEHECSVCGKKGIGIEQYSFCPNCGASMREREDE